MGHVETLHHRVDRRRGVDWRAPEGARDLARLPSLAEDLEMEELDADAEPGEPLEKVGDSGA
jgi:hypothetical protein